MPCSLGCVPVKMLDCTLHVTAGNVGIITELLFSMILEMYFQYLFEVLEHTFWVNSRPLFFLESDIMWTLRSIVISMLIQVCLTGAYSFSVAHEFSGSANSSPVIR